MTKEWTPENVLDVLGDEIARQILVVAIRDPVSADELADECDVSLPSVYRRVNALVEYDLVRERGALDEDGTQYTLFETRSERVTFEVDADGITAEIVPRRNLVDRFGDFWSDLDETRQRIDPDAVETDGPDPTGSGTPHG